ncbi:MAG: hypothetical protein ACT4OT_05610 [Acidobacteriota bacterium]
MVADSKPWTLSTAIEFHAFSVKTIDVVGDPVALPPETATKELVRPCKGRVEFHTFSVKTNIVGS